METQNICVNCKSEISLNFCPNCGQKKYRRIDAQYIREEIQYALLHTNKGFFFTIKNLLRNPGQTTREFIDGNRVQHYKPLLLAFVLSGISTFISYQVLDMGEILGDFFHQQVGASAEEMSQTMTSMSSYLSFIIFLFLPFFALATKVVFGKWGHNYYEHVVMNAFFYSLYTLYTVIIVFPVLYFFRDDSLNFVVITYLSMLIAPVLLVWFFKGFYPDRTMGKIILKVSLTFLLLLAGYIFLSVAGGVASAFISGKL